jgi:hypothetical protein
MTLPYKLSGNYIAFCIASHHDFKLTLYHDTPRQFIVGCHAMVLNGRESKYYSGFNIAEASLHINITLHTVHTTMPCHGVNHTIVNASA